MLLQCLSVKLSLSVKLCCPIIAFLFDIFMFPLRNQILVLTKYERSYWLSGIWKSIGVLKVF